MTEAKPSPWKKLTLLSKTSAKESKESDIVLKWKSFSQSNKKPTEIEKFLWDVNIHNDLSNVDNFVIKDALLQFTVKCVKSRPIQLRAYQLLLDLTISTVHHPFYTTEEIPIIFSSSISSLEYWIKNEHVTAACFDFLASLYLKDINQDTPETSDQVSSLMDIANISLLKFKGNKTIIRAVISYLFKVYQIASMQTLVSSSSSKLIPQVLESLTLCKEEKDIAFRCISILLVIAKKHPETIPIELYPYIIELAVNTLSKHHINEDICSSVFCLLNDIIQQDEHLSIFLCNKEEEFNFMCSAIEGLKLGNNSAETISAVLNMIIKTLNSTLLKGNAGNLKVITDAVNETLKHKPDCDHNCLSTGSCGFNETHVSLCSEILQILQKVQEGTSPTASGGEDAPMDHNENHSNITEGNAINHKDNELSLKALSLDSVIEIPTGPTAKADNHDDVDTELRVDSNDVDADNSTAIKHESPNTENVERVEEKISESLSSHIDTVQPTSSYPRETSVQSIEVISDSNTSTIQQYDVSHIDNIQEIKQELEQWKFLYNSVKYAYDELEREKIKIEYEKHELEILLKNNNNDNHNSDNNNDDDDKKDSDVVISADAPQLQQRNKDLGQQRDNTKNKIAATIPDLEFGAENNELYPETKFDEFDNDYNNMQLWSTDTPMNGSYVDLPMDDANEVNYRPHYEYDEISIEESNDNSQKEYEFLTANDSDVFAVKNAIIEIFDENIKRISSSSHCLLSMKQKKKNIEYYTHDEGLLNKLIIAIINLFQHLKHIQSASIEKVTRTKTIPKFQLRKILNSSEFPMFSGRKNGSSEVDIALQKYNIQITLHEFAVVIVRCACRKFRLIEDSIEARTSFIISLTNLISRYLMTKSTAKSSQSQSNNSSKLEEGKILFDSALRKKLSPSNYSFAINMIDKETNSLKPIYLSYAIVENGMKLENLILFFKEFKVVPSILSSANIIEIFENIVLKNNSTSCGVTRSGPGQITLSYQEFREVLLEVALHSGYLINEINIPALPEAVTLMLTSFFWWLDRSGGREKLCERDRTCRTIPNFRVCTSTLGCSYSFLSDTAPKSNKVPKHI